MKLERPCRSETETMALAAWLGRRMAGGEVLCLEGALGSGKTCFVRGLAEGLGLDPHAVCSPTFILWRKYTDHAPLSLVHLDAFRLAGSQDLEALGWEELLAATDSVIAVEWPSRIRDALPGNRIEIVVLHTAPDVRLVTITAPPDLVSRWGQPV